MLTPIPIEIIKKLKELMKRQEGTLQFNYHSKQLFDPGSGKGKLFEITSGQIYFLLEREPDLILNFYHSSPGTGTRVSSIDLKKIKSQDGVMIFLTWSPIEIGLSVGGLDKSGDLIISKGVKSKKQFIIAHDGSMIQVGDTNLEVKGFTVFKGNKPVLRPPAIEIWDEVKTSIEIIKDQMNIRDYRDEVVMFNSIIVMLVTGFESYTKRRFLEIENEGLKPNFENIIKKFVSKEERDRGIEDVLKEKATHDKLSLIAEFVQQNRINFQNFSDTKDAYNKGYDIKFGEHIPDAINSMNIIRATIRYRHQIIHVSPMAGFIGQEFSPPLPMTPTKDFIPNMIEAFDSFIKKLHEHTLMKKR